MVLNKKQRSFVEHYLVCWNATQAAKDAGYSEKTAYSIGSENLRKPEIAAAIESRLSELKMSADEVLTRLTEHARGSMADFLNDAGDIDLSLARDRGKLHLLKTRSVTKEGERIELYSAQEALQLLGKHHGLFTDVQEQRGDITIRVVYDDADDPSAPSA